jgi:hypothetical protein
MFSPHIFCIQDALLITYLQLNVVPPIQGRSQDLKMGGGGAANVQWYKLQIYNTVYTHANSNRALILSK